MTHALTNRVGTGASGMRTQNPIRHSSHQQQQKIPQARPKESIKKNKTEVSHAQRATPVVELALRRDHPLHGKKNFLLCGLLAFRCARANMGAWICADGNIWMFGG